MIGAVLAGSVLGLLAGAGCLLAGVPVLWALAAWSGSGALAVVFLAFLSQHPRRAAAAVLRPQRA
jgi:hypothetical protein